MAEIRSLIDKRDNFELVRDKIADILLRESQGQQALARAAQRDARAWELRVFTEASDPWVFFPDPSSDDKRDGRPEDELPLVNVWFDGTTYPAEGSDVVEQQTTVGVYNLDCYGTAVSKATLSGHEPGDRAASFEAQRAARLVRNILMAAHYVNLGLPKLVGRRFPVSMQTFQPAQDERPVQHVRAVRFAFQVRFFELSPQHEGAPLELVSVEVKRSPTGQLLLGADYPLESP